MPEIPWDLKGLWIPKEILFANGLVWSERILLTLIFHLDNERGCFASNKLFANFLDVSERQVGRYLAHLEELGYTRTVLKDRYDRTIRMTGKFQNVPDQQFEKLRTMKEALIEKMSTDERRAETKSRSRGFTRQSYEPR